MKRVKLITITLAIVLVTMIAFIGVYVQVQNRMENNIKDYSLAMDLKGTRNIKLKVSDETETIIKDSEGKRVKDSENLTDEEITKNGYVKEEKVINGEDVLNKENYKKSKEIIEKRLKALNFDGYQIKLDEETGEMLIELIENDNTDAMVSNISSVGKFEIVDSETDEVLMNNDDIKTAKVMYANNNQTATAKGTSVYLDIEFNKNGSKKLEEISKTYVKTETEENAETENAETENAEAENTEAENTEASATEKKVTMRVDSTDVMSTSFEEPITIGKLQLSLGTASTDLNTVKENAAKASTMATVLDSGNMPVKYEIDNNEYILSDIGNNELAIAMYAILAITIVGLIVLIVRYKKIGFIGIISYIGFVSILTLVIRYTNVVISIAGILGFVIAMALNYILINKLLANFKKNTSKDEEKTKQLVKEAYINFFVRIIPICIATIVCCFTKWATISSFGMVMFWGLALIAIYNPIITNNLVKIETKK